MAVVQKQIKLLHITTVPQSLGFLTGQTGYMTARGFEVHALSSPGPQLDRFAEREGARVHAVKMARRITPLRDLVALARLRRLMRLIRPQIVHAHTPKGGLLGMIAAWTLRVPIRIYHNHGLPYVTARGSKRLLLRLSEEVACRLADQVLCVSRSNAELAVAEGICRGNRIKVLRKGSINGVDARGAFDPNRVGKRIRRETREGLSIPADAFVLGFVGRVVRDKDLIELAEAWRVLREKFPSLHLLIIGPFERQNPVPRQVEKLLSEDPRIRLTGFADHMPPLYASIDIVVLPTHREGFPVVPLEAAAMALPVVATRVPGCVDAVDDGTTGILVPPGDSDALAEAISKLLHDPQLRDRMGKAGRERALQDFRPEDIWEATLREYDRLLREKGVFIPEDVSAGK